MSVEAISWVLREVRGLKPPERCVLIVLADGADHEWKCWPSLGYIAGCVELTRPSVSAILKRLAAKGLLDTEPRWARNGRRTSNLYRLRGGTPDRAGGTPPVAQGEVPPTGKGEHYIEPPGEPSKKPSADSVADRFEDFWQAYPRKVGKQAARRAFGKAIKRGLPGPVELRAIVQLHALSPGWKKDGGRYIPHPTAWLNQGRWEDVLDYKKTQVQRRFATRRAS